MFSILPRLLDQINNFAILTDKDFNLVVINKIAQKKLGKKNEPATQDTLTDLIENRELKPTLKKINAQKKPKTQKLEIKFKNCDPERFQLIPLEDNQKQLMGWLIKSSNDNSNIISHQELLYDINLYKILVNNVPGINLYLFNNEMQFLIAEGKEMKNIGHTGKYFVNSKLQDLEDEGLREIWQPLFSEALKGKESTNEYFFENYHYKMWVLPLKNKGGEIYGGMAITQNITEEKRYKKKLKRSRDEAEKANQTKSDFLAQISHEIRTPLNAIIGFSEQLSSTELDKKQEEYIKIIDKSSEHLLTLINDILVLSKIEAKEIQFDQTAFKLESVLRFAHKAFLAKAKEKNLGFSYQLDKRLKHVLIGDPFRLRQILINLINNAIKFTKQGYIDVKCFQVDEDESTIIVRFDVADTGIGIESANLEKIFEQFKQSDSRITREFGGTGLGLTICKRLVDLQGGHMSVNSQIGIGTTFTFSLPYKKGKESDLVSADTVAIDKKVLKNKSVLLVDDDSVNRLLGKTILEKFNCKIDIAHDGKEAIVKIEDTPYDVILLDIHMPEVSGIDVVKHLRNKLSDKHTKVIAVTAAALQNEIQSYYKAGFNNILLKPYKEINLFNVICQTLNVKNRMEVQEAQEEDTEQKQETLYNLSDLEAMSNSDGFMRTMIETFSNNARDAIQQLENAKKNNDFSRAGEIAHKLLPSFKHLKVHTVVDQLLKIKHKTLVEKNNKNIILLINDTIEQIEVVIAEIEQQKNAKSTNNEEQR